MQPEVIVKSGGSAAAAAKTTGEAELRLRVAVAGLPARPKSSISGSIDAFGTPRPRGPSGLEEVSFCSTMCRFPVQF
jgi:hypothetical protein